MKTLKTKTLKLLVMLAWLPTILALLWPDAAGATGFVCAGVDDTAALQAAVNAGDVEISGECLIHGYPGVRVPANRTVVATGATLRQTANVGGVGALGINKIFETVPDATNVVFRGGTYIGSRTYVGGLQGDMGIRIDKCTGCLVEQATFQDFYFDGVYVGGNAPGSVDVTVRDNHVLNTKRNGVSVINGSKIRIYRNTLEHANCNSDAPNGVCTSYDQNMPLCGIDFEPNVGDHIEDVIVYDNVIRDNQKCGVFLQDKNVANPGKGFVFIANTLLNNGGLLPSDFGMALNQVHHVIADSNLIDGGKLGYTLGSGVEDIVFSYNEVMNTSGVGLRFSGARNPYAMGNKMHGEDVFFVAVTSPVKMNGVAGNVCLRPFE